MQKENYMKVFEYTDYFDQVNFLKAKNLKVYSEYDINLNLKFEITKFKNVLNEFKRFDNIKKEIETPSGLIETYEFYFSDGLCLSFNINNDDIEKDDYDTDDDHDFLEEINGEPTKQSINNITIYYNNECSDEKTKLVQLLKNCIIKDEKSYFYTIGITRFGYKLEQHETTNNEIDININYGSGFETQYKTMLNKIETSHDGLYLLWGEPGTGKTTLIRKLIGEVKNKKVIYIPAFMVGHLSKPEFIGFLKKYKNMILLLEDAEHVIQDRSTVNSDHGAISNILNMTDGLLNDIIKVQIIATFNTKKENLDKALLREGRLKFEHEFNKLNIEDAQKVVDNLKLDYTVEDKMSLAQIYNLVDYNNNKEKEKSKEKPSIGFKR